MDRFIDYVMPQVPGCPKPLIKIELLRTAILFCTDSWIWQVDAEKEVLASADEITLSVESLSEITGCQISLDGTAVNEYTRSGVTVTLDNAVTVDTTFDTTSFLKPTRAATALPDILYNNWFDAIEAGTKARLMAMPGKKWTDPNMSKMNQRIYLSGLSQAKIKARKTNDQTRLMVTQRMFV